MRTTSPVEEIKSRLDIVDVIGDYVDLKRAGRNFKGLCPFHPEKTPSFIVSPEKQLFHCFGCSEGGDVIGFIIKHEALPFEEAMRLLAKRAGVDFEPAEKRLKEGRSEKEAVKRVVAEAVNFYSESLKRSAPARAYLSDRGVTEETAGEFSLGYAPAGWGSLKTHLAEKGFAEDISIKAGLLSKGTKGVYDFMRERIIFPIFDLEGEAVAFGGRVMDPEVQPKYLNSPDTPVFRKSSTLYGLDKAKAAVRDKGYVLAVEGYLDVIMCWQYGIRNAIAPLGTALTEEHMRRLRRFTDKAVIVFDGDEAGLRAARRAVSIALGQGLKVKVLLLPQGEDPDSILRKKGEKHMRALLADSLPVVDFLLKVTSGDRVDVIKECISVISAATDTVAREELTRELSDRLRIRESLIREEAEKSRKGDSPMVEGLRRAGRFYDEEKLLLSAVISMPELAGEVLKRVDPEVLHDSTVRGVFERISRLEGGFSVEALIENLDGAELALVSGLSIEPGFGPDDATGVVADCLKRIELRKLDEKIRSAEMSGDLGLLNTLLADRQKLMKEERHERTF